MGLLEKVAKAHAGGRSPGGLKGWSEPPVWDLDRLRYPFLGSSSINSEREKIENDFEGYVQGIAKANGPIFALMATRLMVFSEARFQFRRLNNGRPGDLFGSRNLALLENPWPNGTTGDLLARMIQDVDLAGNAFVAKINGRLRRLRPDWVTIVSASKSEPELYGNALDSETVGYFYTPPMSGRETLLLASQVAHFAPIPDPECNWRGMSWMTPVLREISSDLAATRHKGKFFENGATPQVIVSLDASVTPEMFARFKATMNETHAGADNAYRTLYLGGGADVTIAGRDLAQLDFKATQGAGEPLALDTPIPTPTGWTTMGDIRSGDQVIGRNGRPANVVGVSPVHEDRVCYRVTLKDRTSIVADASHLWVAVDRNTAKRNERTYTTQELYEIFVAPYSNGAGGHRLSLPETPAVDLPDADLLIDPYVLGAWLGDGQTAGAAICGDQADLKYIATEIESRGYTVTSWNTGPDKVGVIGIPGGLLATLKAIGVLGSKHIPGQYLRASAGQRLDLLRGLMDTDGSVEHSGKGSCEFSSKFEHLARQVAELVRSLGYRATLSSKDDSRSRTGKTWRVFFRVGQDRIPFLLPRKVARCEAAGDPHVRSRSIVAIEPVDSVPVRCIAVDTDDHLFLAGEGLVPTHNTRMAAAAGVPAVIVGFSEGLGGSSLNAGNFGQARRRFADGTLRPLWRGAAGALAPLVTVPSGAELWYDDRDISFLQEDQRDAAEIFQVQASTIGGLVREGFTAESAMAAVAAQDSSLLVHTGLVSVQLQLPGTTATPPGQVTPPADPSGPDPAKEQ